jgi:hypothetical protein
LKFLLGTQALEDRTQAEAFKHSFKHTGVPGMFLPNS